MSVEIRLRRVGRKAQPYYRVVVTDSRAPRGGAYLDAIGFYNPRLKPAELRLDLERVDAWVAKGAGLSDTVASLVRKARRGGDRTVALKPMANAPAAEAAPAES
jgi:small subunit ribosomal protein S16